MSTAFWGVDPTSVAPPSYTTTDSEDVTLAFDATALLVNGGAPSAPTALLTRIVDNAPDAAVTLADAPTLGTGSTILQRVRGLTANTVYRLRLNFTTSGNVRSMSLIVIVTE